MLNPINTIRDWHAALPSMSTYKADSIQLNLTRPVTLEDRTAVQPSQLTPKDEAALRQQLVQAGQQFEAYFISHLMKIMRETVPQGAISNKQGSYFNSFYDQEIGVRAAESGGIGITQMVKEYAEKNFSSSSVQPSSSSR